MLGKLLIKAVRVPVGFTICLIGVLLPWRMRNAYMNIVGSAVDVMLRSDTFVNFFMAVGFAGYSEHKES